MGKVETEAKEIETALAAAVTAKEIGACHDRVLELPHCNTRARLLTLIKAAYAATLKG